MSRQVLSPQLRNQIVQVVIKLSVIADVAAGAGSAMAPDVGNDDQDVFGRELLGDAIHAGRVTAGAVNQDGDVFLIAVGGGINPIGE